MTTPNEKGMMELKPCPGCGEPMKLTPRQTMKPAMLACEMETSCAFSNIEILPRMYEQAYCWKELESEKAKVKGLVEALELIRTGQATMPHLLAQNALSAYREKKV